MTYAEEVDLEQGYYTVRVKAPFSHGASHNEATASFTEALAEAGIEVIGAKYEGHEPEIVYWAVIYDEGQGYGGPEEGGWWFNTGQLEEAEGFYTRSEALERVSEWRESGDWDDTGYRYSSYGIYVEELPSGKEPLESYPEFQPHYE